MAKPLKVEVPQVRWLSTTGHLGAGVSFLEWQAMSKRQRLIARLRYIRDEAAQMGAVVYHEGCGLPGNAIADAQRLARLATDALEAAHGSDLGEAALLALEVGLEAERLNVHAGVWQALQVKKSAQQARARGGAEAAQTRQEEQAERMAEIAQRWHKLTNPERDRAGIIADRMGLKIDTVRRLIKKAGLR